MFSINFIRENINAKGSRAAQRKSRFTFWFYSANSLLALSLNCVIWRCTCMNLLDYHNNSFFFPFIPLQTISKWIWDEEWKIIKSRVWYESRRGTTYKNTPKMFILRFNFNRRKSWSFFLKQRRSKNNRLRNKKTKNDESWKEKLEH